MVFTLKNREQYVAPIPFDQILGIDQMYGDDST